MSFSGHTRFQKMKRAGQPYTVVRADKKYEEVEVEVDGQTVKGMKVENCFSIRGHTLEERIDPDAAEDAEPELYWEEYDLGQQPTLAEAHREAADWRESLRGQYEIR